MAPDQPAGGAAATDGAPEGAMARGSKPAEEGGRGGVRPRGGGGGGACGGGQWREGGGERREGGGERGREMDLPFVSALREGRLMGFGMANTGAFFTSPPRPPPLPPARRNVSGDVRRGAVAVRGAAWGGEEGGRRIEEQRGLEGGMQKCDGRGRGNRIWSRRGLGGAGPRVGAKGQHGERAGS